MRAAQQQLPYVVAFVLCLYCLVLATIADVGIREIMWLKILFISIGFIVVPRLNLGHWRQATIMVASALVIARFGILPDGKGFAVTSIVLALLVLPQGPRRHLLVALILTAPFLFVQDEVRSRALLATTGVFLALTLSLRFYRSPFLLWLFSLAYPVAMATFGASFLFGDGWVTAIASNLARTTMIYTIVTNLAAYPWGYPDAATYFGELSLLAQNLFSDTYNDPHNLFVSAIVWGGYPLLVFSSLCFYLGFYRAAATATGSLSAVLAASALCVFISTSTLSFSNVLFFFLLLVHLSPTKSPTLVRGRPDISAPRFAPPHPVEQDLPPCR